LSELNAAPFFLAASLVVLGGLAKVRRPAVASRALASIRLPSQWWAVRTLGGAEIAVGVWALVAPTPASALALAVLYLAFAAFLLVMMVARVPSASCGCVGASDAPPSILHVALDLAAVASGVLAVANPVPSIGSFLGDQPLAGIPILIATAAAGYAAYLAVGLLPALREQVRRSSRLGHHHEHLRHAGSLLRVARLERSP
jgi:hypothetical protein